MSAAPSPAGGLRVPADRPRVTAAAALAVVMGGAAGTAARAGLDALVPATGGWPWATLAGNVLGALLLGALLARRPGRATRLLAATGFLGAFTTYSALAVQTVELAADGSAARAVAYAGGSLALGLAAVVAGASLGRPRRAPA